MARKEVAWVPRAVQEAECEVASEDLGLATALVQTLSVVNHDSQSAKTLVSAQFQSSSRYPSFLSLIFLVAFSSVAYVFNFDFMIKKYKLVFHQC